MDFRLETNLERSTIDEYSLAQRKERLSWGLETHRRNGSNYVSLLHPCLRTKLVALCVIYSFEASADDKA